MILPVLDVVALAWFVALVAAYEFISFRPGIHEHSLAAAVQRHRIDWMLCMSARDNRIVDGQLLGWLVNASAFFASTSVIVLGGLAALLGYGDRARLILEALPFASRAGTALWEIKIIFLMIIMVFAFFKFAWAFRLSHYTVIMMGATPPHNSADPAARMDHAERAAALLGLVGEHSNQGIRSFYYTIAGLMWFFHPLAFIAATTWVVAILVRREFWSHSLQIIKGGSATARADRP